MPGSDDLSLPMGPAKNTKVAKMKESVDTVKTEKKIRVDLLRAFLD